MYKKKRNDIDKLKTLFFGKDLRVTEGDAYTEVRKYDFSSYYPEENYIKKQGKPRKNVVDIREYGADVQNSNNAPFINKAIEKASQIGGVVLVDGGDYVTATVNLLSNVTLFITKNSSLCANETGKGYESKKAILYAENCENISLKGGGKIKGNGHLFGFEPVASENNTTPPKYIDVIEMRKDYRSQLRFAHPSKYGGPIYFKNCKNISVDNFIIENSANADGIDIAGTSNVNISHCFISTADDGIVIKNASWLGNTGVMKNIKISDCEIISRTNAIKVGTETTYDISDIYINDCKLFMTDLYPGSVSGISLEACDGTVLSNINIDNITMDRCTCPIFIRLANRNRAAEVNSQSANAIEFGKKGKGGADSNVFRFNMLSEVRDINISNITATRVELPVIIAGYKQFCITKRVKNVTLKNIFLDYYACEETVDKRRFIPEYAKTYPEGWRFRNLPSYALWSRHTQNLKLENFNCNHPVATWKKDIINIDDI